MHALRSYSLREGKGGARARVYPSGIHASIQQTPMEPLLCARHCARCGGHSGEAGTLPIVRSAQSSRGPASRLPRAEGAPKDGRKLLVSTGCLGSPQQLLTQSRKEGASRRRWHLDLVLKGVQEADGIVVINS